MKYLLVIAVVVLVLWLLTAQRRRQVDRSDDEARDRGENAAPAPGRASTPAAASPTMVRCAHCGVHLPQAEAVTAGALHYCSPQHRDAGPAQSR